MRKIKLKDKMLRADPSFENELQSIARARLKNDLVKDLRKRNRELSSRELTRLLIRAPSWPRVRKELSTLPKTEDLT